MRGDEFGMFLGGFACAAYAASLVQEPPKTCVELSLYGSEIKSAILEAVTV